MCGTRASKTRLRMQVSLDLLGRIGVYPLRYRVCAFKRRACPFWRHSACGCRVCAATTSPLKGSGSGSSSSPRRSVLLCLRFWSRCHWALVWRVSSLRAAGTSTSSVPYGSSSFATFLAKPCSPESLEGAFCFKLQVAMLWGLAMIHLHRSPFERKLSLRCVKAMHLPWPW